MKTKLIAILMLITASITLTYSAEKYKPFILSSNSNASINASLDDIKTKLTEAGFDIAGEYRPLDNRHILIISNRELLKNAAKTKFGGFGSALRVSLSEYNGKLQVAYTNPVYWAEAFQLKSQNSAALETLKNTLGFIKEFGSEEGLSLSELKKYHYMFGMPYFDDMLKLGKFASYNTCIEKVENGLRAKKGNVEKAYRLDIPGKKMTVFGVALNKGDGGDKNILNTIDNNSPMHTAHLPYEILVVDNQIYALHAKFRIAISWPDLSMMGEGSFASIMSAPGSIEDALEALLE